MARLGRRYLILDTETATLPFANEITKTVNEKRTIAISKPLIYDIAWRIVDRNGKIYSEHSYLVAEIFNTPSVFNTAYYAEKRPKYIERLNKGEITIKQWDEIMEILIQDLESVDYVGAFNSMFDYKKAIPFTEKYIKALHSSDYFGWEREQKERCKRILTEKSNYKNPNWDGMNFDFRDKKYPLIDLWGIACEMLINTQTYKRKCLQFDMVTESGQFFKSSAETTFRYICEQYDFEEMHMAIDDVIIECQILCKALKKGKITEGLQYFPFQMLGKTTKFIMNESKRVIPVDEVATVIEKIKAKLKTYEKESTFATTLENEMYQLIQYLNERHAKKHQYELQGYEIRCKQIVRRIGKLKIQIEGLKTDKAIDKRMAEIDILRDEYYALKQKMQEVV